jgi:hypothetical protein
MKKFVLALTFVAAFAIASQADEAKPSKNMKDSACCSKTTTQVKAKAKGESCSSCCKQKQVKLLSPKAAAEMGR